MKSLTKIANIFDRIINGGAFVAAVLLVLIMFVISFDVVTRYSGNPQRWTIEIIEYTLLYITFLGTAWLLKREGHVRIDLLTNSLSSKTQALLGILSSVIGILISSILIIYGSQITWEYLVEGHYQSTILKLPSAPFYAIIPIGSLLLFIQFLRSTYGYVVKYKESIHGGE